MARQRGGVNKSEEIRKLLEVNPDLTRKEAVAALAEKGIKVSGNLFYYIKGQVKGRRRRKKKANKLQATVTRTNGVAKGDALATILKVKALAEHVGGLKALRALIEALDS